MHLCHSDSGAPSNSITYFTCEAVGIKCSQASCGEGTRATGFITGISSIRACRLRLQTCHEDCLNVTHEDWLTNAYCTVFPRRNLYFLICRTTRSDLMSDRMTCDIIVLILHILISNITSSQFYLSKKKRVLIISKE